MQLLTLFPRFYSLLFLLWLWFSTALAYGAEPVIEIEGGTKALRENILQHLTLADESCKAPTWRLNSLLENAEDEIRSAAQALGYYHLDYDTKFNKNKDCWGLTLKLTPGEPVLIKEVRIEILGQGAEDPIFQPLYDKPGIKVGQRLNHGRYETLKARFGNLASSHGYFDAEFAHAQVGVSVSQKTAVVELIFNTGSRYKISDINIKHDILEEKFLRRYLNIAEGDYYDSDKLLELKNLYNGSNYFAAATASPNLQALKDDTVSIDIELEARKRHAYSVGAGITADAPRLLLGFEDRYLNRRGHRFNADYTVSDVKTAVAAKYTIPMRNPAYEFLTLITGYEKETTDTSVSRKYIYGSSYTYYQSNRWLQTYALNYEQENSLVGTEPEVSTDLIIPSVAFLRTKTDGVPYPLSGWSFLSRLSGSPTFLGSDLSFVQFYSRGKYVQSLPVGRLLLRAELGLTETDEFTQLPASLRYFAGGDASIRGYAYESLGPTGKDKDGKEVVIGGNNLLVTSVEYDYRFTDKDWVVAAFYDQGNAADDFDIDVKRAVGVGVRWISPIGPIRVDVAQALDDEKEWRFHISMGPDL